MIKGYFDSSRYYWKLMTLPKVTFICGIIPIFMGRLSGLHADSIFQVSLEQPCSWIRSGSAIYDVNVLAEFMCSDSELHTF